MAAGGTRNRSRGAAGDASSAGHGARELPREVDVAVVGSGFGGSVAALRLVEKGYRVAVLEAGRRFTPQTLPRTSWDVSRFLWAPRLGWLGLQRIHVLRDVVILAGAGVGGGSLVYANTLYEPEPTSPFWDDPQWAHLADWRAELAPFYDQARRMLGVVDNPTVTPADEVVRATAHDLGVEGSFRLAPVGVVFGAPGARVPDPFFGGVGPERRGCLQCGECMTGCRHGAKNTLVTNYLWLAERAGAVVVPETTVTRLRPRADGRWDVTVTRTGRRGPVRTVVAGQVVVAAGAWGTQQLLHRLKADGTLPALSARLGALSRTNSESLGGAAMRWRGHRTRPDLTRGVAITSSVWLDERTHLEPVRYGHGSNLMGLLSTVLTDGGGRVPRPVRWLGQVLRHPGRVASLLLGIGSWSRRTVIGLVMQTGGAALTVRPRRTWRGGWRLTSTPDEGEPNPTWIPRANEAYRAMAAHLDGFAASSLGEVVDVPMTAHFIGGCTIGDSPATGVVDPYHRAFGYPGLHVVDGSTVSANLGVNPSLTITAQAERAFAMWPNRGEPDPRPAVGDAYRRVDPVAPVRPVVPAHARGALRLTVVRRDG
jgi:cholesterol oxidase